MYFSFRLLDAFERFEMMDETAGEVERTARQEPSHETVLTPFEQRFGGADGFDAVCTVQGRCAMCNATERMCRTWRPLNGRRLFAGIAPSITGSTSFQFAAVV